VSCAQLLAGNILSDWRRVTVDALVSLSPSILCGCRSFSIATKKKKKEKKIEKGYGFVTSVGFLSPAFNAPCARSDVCNA